MHTLSYKCQQALLIFIYSRLMKPDMRLHPNSIYAQTSLLEIAYQIDHCVALTFRIHRVIIIVELCIRISLMSIPECQRNELSTKNLIEIRVAP